MVRSADDSVSGTGSKRTRLGSVQDAARAVDVAAAERDNAEGRATEQAHQIARLRAGAENQIDDDVRRRRAQRPGMLAERPPIADDLVGCGRRAAVKDHDVVALPLQRTRDVRADEAAAADKEDTHRQFSDFL